MKWITGMVIILVLFIIYSATDCEHMASVTTDTRIVVSDRSGNMESIGFPLLYSEIDKDPNNYRKNVPCGAIMMWNGDLTTIPRGWKLCDGIGSTPANDGVAKPKDLVIPDLRGRFIVGVNPSATRQMARNAYEMRAMGGAETHTLTVAEMPSHTHTYSHFAGDIAGVSTSRNRNQYWYQGSVAGTSAVTGGNAPHNNLPPFYTLAYIIKVV